MGCAIWLIMLIVVLAVDFFIVAGCTALICWAFGLSFTWQAVAAVWFVINVLAYFFTPKDN